VFYGSIGLKPVRTWVGRCALLAISVLTLVPARPSLALEVVTHYIGGAAPANAAGGGNLGGVFNAAARRWEAAYRDPFTIHLYFGWGRLGDAGTHALAEQGGVPNRETSGTILFDSSGAVAFYLDPTPDADEEYLGYTEQYADLGGGRINVARVFRDPTGEARGRCDLLSVALHEIGHALGMCNANLTFVEASRHGSLSVPPGRPFSGSIIPLATNYSGVTSHFDPSTLPYGAVMQGLCDNERRVLSALDILANAGVSGFSDLNLDPRSPRSSIASRSCKSIRAGRNGPRDGGR
jgi:hypothetical protein